LLWTVAPSFPRCAWMSGRRRSTASGFRPRSRCLRHQRRHGSLDRDYVPGRRLHRAEPVRLVWREMLGGYQFTAE